MESNRNFLIFGVIDNNNCLTDISKSEIGTKRYATKNNYDKIGCRNVNSYNAFHVAFKVGKKWHKVENPAKEN